MPRNVNNPNMSMQDLEDIGKRLGLKYFAGHLYYGRRDIDFVTFSTRKLKLRKITNKEDSTGPILDDDSWSYFTILDIYGQFGPPISKSIWRTYEKTSHIDVSKQELLVSAKTLRSIIFFVL